MASETIIAQIRKGMEIHTADGHTLGKVTEIWYGTDPTANNARGDEDLCSRLEVHRGFVGRAALYIPSTAIASVSSNSVVLTVDAATVDERPWHEKPHWIPIGKAPIPKAMENMPPGSTPPGRIP